MTPSARRPLRRALGAFAALAITGTLAAAAPSVYAWSAARERLVVGVDAAPVRDVAIIFGAEAYPSGTPSPYLRARLDLGVQLVREGRAKVLLVSGDNSPEHNSETAAMRRYLQARGVPAERIVEDEAGLDTYATCVRARDVFGLESALLVSQSYHLTRAVATCRAVGVDAVGVGDETLKWSSPRWTEFTLREFAANVKMAVDLTSARQPRLDPPSDAVRRALAS